jgi:hypothetical protein
MKELLKRRKPEASGWDIVVEAASIVAGQQPAGMQRLMRSFPAYLRDQLEKDAGILTLTAEPADILMWSHYADQHKGLCLEFDTMRGIDVFRDALPIRYTKTFPQIDGFKFGSSELVEPILLTKSEHWSYEQEWRIIRVPDGRGVVTLPPESLTAVIIGARISEKDEIAVREWINRSRARPVLKRARLDEQSYTLVIADAGAA